MKQIRACKVSLIPQTGKIKRPVSHVLYIIYKDDWMVFDRVPAVNPVLKFQLGLRPVQANDLAFGFHLLFLPYANYF
jgi:hypothetical protein